MLNSSSEKHRGHHANFKFMFRAERETEVGFYGKVASRSQGVSELIGLKRGVSLEDVMILCGGFGKANGPLYKRGSLNIKLPKWGHWQISGDKLVGLGVSVSSLRRREEKQTPRVCRMGPLGNSKVNGSKRLGLVRRNQLTCTL